MSTCETVGFFAAHVDTTGVFDGLKTEVQRLQYAVSAESRERRRRLRPEVQPFTIVSNDCWGAEVYKDLGLPFTTPFIGLFIAGPCYMRMVSDFKRIVQSPLRFIEKSKYPDVVPIQERRPHPTGLLDDDVEIHFLHFDSQHDAATKWNKRVERIAYDRSYFKISADSDMPFSDAELHAFDALPHRHKLVLTKRTLPTVSCAVTIPEYIGDGKLMYDVSMKYFDIVEWLNAD